MAEGLPGVQRAEILNLCDEVDTLSRQLSDLCRRGEGNSPQAQQIARLAIINQFRLYFYVHFVCFNHIFTLKILENYHRS